MFAVCNDQIQTKVIVIHPQQVAWCPSITSDFMLNKWLNEEGR